MRSRHVLHVDRFPVFGHAHLPASRVIPEAILYANDNPRSGLEASSLRRNTFIITHQRLVKTTPKPNATKNRRGDELLPPPLLLPFGPPPLSPLLAGGSVVVGADVVDVGTPVDVVPVGADVVVTCVCGVDDAAEVRVLSVCLTTIRAPSTTAGLIKAIFRTTNPGQVGGDGETGFKDEGRPSGAGCSGATIHQRASIAQHLFHSVANTEAPV